MAIFMPVLEFILSSINVQVILVVFALCLFLSFHLKHTRQCLPPGPWRLPLLGSLPVFAMEFYRTGAEQPEYLLADMAKKYGNIFSLKIGPKLLVIVNDCESIKTAFKNPQIYDRPESELLTKCGLIEGLSVNSGKSVKYQRPFTLNTFRTFGVGRSAFEGNITQEAEMMVKAIRGENEMSFDPHTIIGSCVSNIICSVVFGKRYDHTDPEFKHLILLLDTTVNNMGPGGATAFLPFSKYLFPVRYRELSSTLGEFAAFIKGHVDEHRKSFDKENLNDIVDVFLNEIDIAADESGDRAEYIHLQSLVATGVMFFAAGSETTTTFLRWALLYMMMYPEIQAKVQSELDTVTCRTRMPQWADRLMLPYTEAVLTEVMRIRTVAPLGLPHAATEDTKLAGYDIPKGTYVWSNIWAMHNDTALWKEPEQFRPERFINEDGKFCRPEEVMPFSTGNRVCIGENLARMELFLFFTYVLHSFTITRPPGSKLPSMKGISGITFGPKPYKIVAKIRNV